MLLNEFFQVKFKWPGRKKNKKTCKRNRQGKEDNVKKTLESAKSISITTDGWTSVQQHQGFNKNVL